MKNEPEKVIKKEAVADHDDAVEEHQEDTVVGDETSEEVDVVRF